MEITVTKDQNAMIVSVAGRMDTITGPDFQKKMEEVLGQGEKEILVDFEKLEYISSAGLRAVLMAAKQAKAGGGTLLCCGLRDMVKKVFDISGFSSMIPVFDSLDEALSRK